MNKRRALGVVLVVLGGLLAANPLYIYQHPDEINEVLIVSEPQERPEANYSYADLSPRARALFDEARAAEDNSTTFHGRDSRPEEFDFVDDESAVGFAGHFYRVDQAGDTYYVWAFEQPSVGEEQRRSQALVGLGFALLLVGVLYAWRGNQPMAIGLSLGALGAVMLLLNLSYRYARDLLGPVNAIGGSVFVLLALLFGIAGTGYLGYLTAREQFTDRAIDPGDGSR